MHLPDSRRSTRNLGENVPQRQGSLSPTAQSPLQLKQSLARDPASFEAAFWLGVKLRDGGDIVQALDFAKRAVELDPTDAPAHGSLASCLSLMNRTEEAIASFERAIELDPSCYAYRHNIGSEFERLGRYEDAIETYRLAINLDPSSPYSLVTLGRLLRDRNRNEEAAECFSMATSVVPKESNSLLELARSFYEEGVVDEAEHCLRKAVALDPDSADALALLGTVLLQLGRFENARTALERTIELRPRAARPYIELVGSRKTLDDHRPLLERMSGMLQDRSLTPEDRRGLHYALGKAYDDLADYRMAIRHYDEANGMMLMQLAGHPFDRERHTSGLNQMIEGFSEKFLSTPRHFGIETEKPILIVGMIRSGTTLVEQIVSSHPDVAAGGEQTYLIQRYQRVMSPPAGTSRMKEATDFANGYVELLGSVGDEKPRVTDKMPNNYFLLGLVHTLFPNVRMIHCRRNPADTCTSIYTTPFPRPLSFAHSPDSIVFYYREYQRIMEHWRKVLPTDRFFEVDYEELIANPEPMIRRIIEFCGLNWDDACLHHYLNGGAIRTPSWWQARQPVYQSSVGRWEHYAKWLGEFRELQ